MMSTIPDCSARPKYKHKWNLDFKVGDDYICCQDCGYKFNIIGLYPFNKDEIEKDYFALTPTEQHEEIRQRLHDCWDDAKIRARNRR